MQWSYDLMAPTAWGPPVQPVNNDWVIFPPRTVDILLPSTFTGKVSRRWQILIFTVFWSPFQSRLLYPFFNYFIPTVLWYLHSFFVQNAMLLFSTRCFTQMSASCWNWSLVEPCRMLGARTKGQNKHKGGGAVTCRFAKPSIAHRIWSKMSAEFYSQVGKTSITGETAMG